jgi:predicted enzyme related to lactoylglutathione lyase
MNNSANALNWFEIPATDYKRAQSFYENIFGIQMEHSNMMDMDMVMFPGDSSNGKVYGALVQSAFHKPSADGALVYLNANEAGMDTVLTRIPTAGGNVVMPKTQITPEIGYMAMFMDTEGNRVALHSSN